MKKNRFLLALLMSTPIIIFVVNIIFDFLGPTGFFIFAILFSFIVDIFLFRPIRKKKGDEK